MVTEQQLQDFFDTIAEDPRIGSNHIVVYLALVHAYVQHGCPQVLEVATHEVRKFTGIRALDTYLRRLRELAEFGYITYLPAMNAEVKARITFKRL